MTETFSPRWLALREPFDTAARSTLLARRFAAALPARPRILDLGAGTGSLFRWLAPIIGRRQSWTFADADGRLMAHAFITNLRWAKQHGHAGAWRVNAIVVDLAAAPEALPLDRVDAVVCSAFLDLVSAQWVERLAGALRTPLFACLSVDGRDAFLPRHPFDRTVMHGFRHDQGRDKGFGPALGPRAPAVLHAALAVRGFTVTEAVSDWRIRAGAHIMARELVQGHACVAARHLPARRGAIAAWQRARLHQADLGKLAIRIGHRDSLALPRQE